MPEPPFKTCGSCGRSWSDWRSFLLDRRVRLLGLQAAPGVADANAIVFEHRCGSTVSVLAHRLRRLLGPEEPVAGLAELYGSPGCNGNCRTIENLALCDRPCVNARDRKLTLRVAELMAVAPRG